MRTRASFRSHPIHPALVPYPIAALHGAFVCDVAGRALGRADLWRLGRRLSEVGIGAGLLAAVPGLIDYFSTVPPKSSAKTRATKHMLVNAGALTLFAAARLLRGRRKPPGLGVLGLEAAGVGLLTSGAWMGSTLIHRNFIGPDHRYPEASRWSAARIDSPEPEVRGAERGVTVARADDFEVGQMRLVELDGERIVLARTDSGFSAFDDRCSHRGASLADGVLICDTVQCLWHGSRFDVKTGRVEAGPADEAIRRYPVEVVDGEVRILWKGTDNDTAHGGWRPGSKRDGARRRDGVDARGALLRRGAAPRV